jgi:hypothetical protein
MMQSHGNTMFVGIKTNEKLRDQLASSKTTMKPLFKDNNPEFLQVMQIDDDEYIGKTVENGVTLESLGNFYMNVKTMLNMICPNFYITEGAIKIIALTPLPARTFY